MSKRKANRYHSLSAMLTACAHLFFPKYCLTCSDILVDGEKWICTTCYYHLLPTDDHEYVDSLVKKRLCGRIPLEQGMALYKFRQAGQVQRIIYHLKYKHKPALGQWLGQTYGSTLREAGLADNFDLIVPVPLHSSKLRKRGYNQSDYFARGLSESLGVAWNNQCLARIRNTATQTLKNKIERSENVACAFCVTNQEAIQGQRILLVDDVITTGATLEACSLALLSAGALDINIATIAATDT